MSLPLGYKECRDMRGPFHFDLALAPRDKRKLVLRFLLDLGLKVKILPHKIDRRFSPKLFVPVELSHPEWEIAIHPWAGAPEVPVYDRWDDNFPGELREMYFLFIHPNHMPCWHELSIIKKVSNWNLGERRGYSRPIEGIHGGIYSQPTNIEPKTLRWCHGC